MTDPTPLSPAAQSVWDAFNEDEAGVFVDYGNKLAAALRAAADGVVPEEHPPWKMHPWQEERYQQRCVTRRSLYIIADELEGAS